MEFGSVITVLLYITTTFKNENAFPRTYEMEIGGMNETELHDVKQFANPSSESQNFNSWSANWKLENFSRGYQDFNRLSSPPLKLVAPFLSKIKTWGYKITFYENYQNSFGQMQSSSFRYFVPTIVHSWILEKDSEVSVLPLPPPTTTATTTTTTSATTTTKAWTATETPSTQPTTISVIPTMAIVSTTGASTTPSISSKMHESHPFLIFSIILALPFYVF